MDWKVGSRFVCERGRTWVVESVQKAGTHRLMLGARCVLPSAECPDAIGDVGCFDAAKVARLEAGSGTGKK